MYVATTPNVLAATNCIDFCWYTFGIEPTLFSVEDYPGIRAYKPIKDIILDMNGGKTEFRRGDFTYTIHIENKMLPELHTQYNVVGTPLFAVGPWGYVLVAHNGTGSLKQTLLRAYYVIPPGDNLDTPIPVLIGAGFDSIEDAMSALEDGLINGGSGSDNEDIYAGDIFDIGVAHATPIH